MQPTLQELECPRDLEACPAPFRAECIQLSPLSERPGWHRDANPVGIVLFIGHPSIHGTSIHHSELLQCQDLRAKPAAGRPAGADATAIGGDRMGATCVDVGARRYARSPDRDRSDTIHFMTEYGVGA